MTLQPVILCGGSGTRMWPLSREQYPKQLLNLAGEDTMLQATATRLEGLPLPTGQRLLNPLLIGNEEYRFLMAEQLRQAGVAPAAILLEPFGRNTAPALTLAALLARVGGDDPVMVVMPADHVIQDGAAFHAAVNEAAPLADAGKLVTFGICPTAPETGYGYIRLGQQIGETASVVERFVEKPDAATAESYLASGQSLFL